MRREIKTFEWVCARCGVVEEQRMIVDHAFPAVAYPMPSGWRQEYEPVPKPFNPSAYYLYQAKVLDLCGGCDEPKEKKQ